MPSVSTTCNIQLSTGTTNKITLDIGWQSKAAADSPILEVWYLPSLWQHPTSHGVEGVWLVLGPCSPLLGSKGSGAISRTHGQGTVSPRNLNAQGHFCPSAAPLKVKGCHEVVRAMATQSHGRQALGKQRKWAGSSRKANPGRVTGHITTHRLQGAQLQIHLLPASLTPLQTGVGVGGSATPEAAWVRLCSLKPTAIS